ncbi:MAG: lasso peptide biosynthesis B2 protein [Rhodothermales bacterium]|nr:lasso peptide biosynthesis B2 protein [Rhodothermales bacterium]
MPTFSRRELRPGDWVRIARICGMLARIVALQKRVSVARLVASFDSAPAEQRDRIDIGRINWLTRGVLRRLFSGRYCMKRSLILFHFLRKAGREARIVFGVTKEEGKLEGHAWVTVNGEPYAEEGPVDKYTVTYVYPDSASTSG